MPNWRHKDGLGYATGDQPGHDWVEVSEVPQADIEEPADIPIGEVDYLLTTLPTVGWHILKQLGIE